jgi:hypothetical protein
MTVIEELSGGSMSSLRSPLMKILVFGPPLIYLLLLTGAYYYRHRNGDSIKVRSRKAYSRLSSALKAGGQAASMSDGCAMVLDALRNYLGDKLHLTGNALTFNDVKDRLSAGGLDQTTMSELEALFRRCEEGRYAGNAGTGDVKPLIQKALKLAKEIEKRFK